MKHFPLAKWAGINKVRWAAVYVILVVIVAGAYGLTQTPDFFDELQAVEDARIAAEQQDQLEDLQRKALQDQCGGPEATAVENARGGYDCFDTNGKLTKTIPGLARPDSTTNEIAARAKGARLQREVLKAPFKTKSAGLVPVGFLKG